MVTFVLLFISTEVQISFHVTDHQDNFYEKGNFITECDLIYS